MYMTSSGMSGCFSTIVGSEVLCLAGATTSHLGMHYIPDVDVEIPTLNEPPRRARAFCDEKRLAPVRTLVLCCVQEYTGIKVGM
jgi:hypothetical protein